jgi:hypothetical protein
MKTTDSLFTLIKSLNKTEKGYLKKHSNFHVINDRNNYIKIFDAINAQDVYNEDKLLKKIKNERFIKQFAVAKNYLYDIILESLEAYNKSLPYFVILSWLKSKVSDKKTNEKKQISYSIAN